MKGVLRVWSGQDCSAVPNPAINYCRFAFSRLDVQTLGIASQHFNASVFVHLSVDKDASSIVVCSEYLRHSTAAADESLPIHRYLCRSGTFLAVVYKAGKCQSPAHSREEAQLPVANHLIPVLGSSHLKLTLGTSVITSSTQTEILASFVDVSRDETVSSAVEGPAVSKVCTARHDKEGAGSLPWLFEKGIRGNGNDCVVGAQ